MRGLISKTLAALAVAAATSYPAYVAYDIVTTGSLGEHCTRKSGRSGGGAFCEWGPNLGALLFGSEQAHLGFALLMGAVTLFMLGIVLLAFLGSSKKT